ncbi:hypothetical protein BH18ACT15_BH18ACT15_07320 [soil metagenome]
MRSLADERGFFLTWFVKLVVGLAVVAIVAYDSGSIIVNYFGLDSAADAVAVTVSSGVGNGSLTSPLAVRRAAAVAARHEQAKLLGAHVGTDNIIHVRLRRTAHTLVVEHLAPIRAWGTATAGARADAN